MSQVPAPADRPPGGSTRDTALLRLLVESVADYAIFVLDPTGQITTWNRGAERLKGYTADEAIGGHISRFYSEDDRAADVPGALLAQAADEGRCESEGWRYRKDGSRFWASVVLTALREDGELVGYAKITRDLTERKRSEDALRDGLEREREAADRLRELDGLRTELVAVVAHDLRSPISVFRGYTEMLLTEWSNLPDEAKLRMVERMASRAQNLSELVDEVFDAARIETRQLQVESRPVDVGALVQLVVEDATLADPERTVTMEVAEGLPHARGDARRTWQVLGNLVDNAVKFSPPGSPVHIRARRDGQDVVVTVTDAGPGITREDQALVFERFGRLAQSKGVPGSGLGLFIARTLIEAQGGRIWVESEPPAGATFAFTLPALDG